MKFESGVIVASVVFEAIRPRKDTIPATLIYSPDDPAVVRMDLHGDDETVTWGVGRDLLYHGLHGSAGSGDVRVVSLAGRTWITLSSPSGRLVMWAPTGVLAEMVEASWVLVPRDTEWALTVDAILQSLTVGGAS